MELKLMSRNGFHIQGHGPQTIKVLSLCNLKAESLTELRLFNGNDCDRETE